MGRGADRERYVLIKCARVAINGRSIRIIIIVVVGD